MALDSHWSQVTLLVSGEGPTLVDTSSHAGDLTTSSYSYTFSSTQFKIGAKSVALATGGIRLAPAAYMTFGANDLTIEGWAYQNTRAYGSTLFRANYDSGTWNGRIQVYLGSTLYGLQVANSTGTAFGIDMVPTAPIPALGTWNHWAVTRQGDLWTLWLNGVSVGSATYSVNLPAATGTFAIGTGAGSTAFDGYIDEFRVTNGFARYTAAFEPSLLPFPTTGSGADLYAPTPLLTFDATAVVLHADVSANAPSPLLLSHAGAYCAPFTAPSPLLSSLGHDSTGEQAAYLTAPSPALTITTGASAKALRAPSPALTATGTVTSMATANLSAPKPTLTATGKVSAMATTALSAPGPNLVGYGGAVCSVSVTGHPTLTASVTTGGVARVAVTCPLFELTAVATAQNHGSANLLAPSPELGRTIQAWLTAPSARLTAIGSAVVTATYEAYAVNLGHRPRVTNQELPIDEVTRYTNFPFTHVVRYQNSYYGANTTGLYLLEGTTDAGTPIPWAVKTAMDDFKTPLKKTVAAAYFGGRFGPASTVQLHAGEDSPSTYSFSTPRDALAQNHRQVFGKGVKERYFALGASGIGVCEIDSVELETHNMTRRI